eukprot:3184508-Rhodomonas_salina.1
MEQLLARVAADASRPTVVARLAKLLTPSFLPVNKPPPELLTRAMTMIRQNSQVLPFPAAFPPPAFLPRSG